MERPMTFEEAVEVVKEYAVGYEGAGLGLLDGLQFMRDELSREEDDIWLTQRQIAAYRIVCREMRKLFV